MIPLGSNTKAAISRIVAALPFLKADGNAIPTAQRATLEAIRKDAARESGGPRDVQLVAAEAWATSEIEKALEEDQSANVPAPFDAAAESGGALPGVISSPTASVEHGGVALSDDRPLGEVSDAELEALTQPEAAK